MYGRIWRSLIWQSTLAIKIRTARNLKSILRSFDRNWRFYTLWYLNLYWSFFWWRMYLYWYFKFKCIVTKNEPKVDKVDCRSVSTCVTIFRVIWVYARSLKYKDTEKITKNRRMFLFAIMQNTFTKYHLADFWAELSYVQIGTKIIYEHFYTSKRRYRKNEL